MSMKSCKKWHCWVWNPDCTVIDEYEMIVKELGNNYHAGCQWLWVAVSWLRLLLLSSGQCEGGGGWPMATGSRSLQQIVASGQPSWADLTISQSDTTDQAAGHHCNDQITCKVWQPLHNCPRQCSSPSSDDMSKFATNTFITWSQKVDGWWWELSLWIMLEGGWFFLRY